MPVTLETAQALEDARSRLERARTVLDAAQRDVRAAVLAYDDALMALGDAVITDGAWVGAASPTGIDVSKYWHSEPEA